MQRLQQDLHGLLPVSNPQPYMPHQQFQAPVQQQQQQQQVTVLQQPKTTRKSPSKEQIEDQTKQYKRRHQEAQKQHDLRIERKRKELFDKQTK